MIKFVHVNLWVPSMLRLIHRVVTSVRIEEEGTEKQSARWSLKELKNNQTVVYFQPNKRRRCAGDKMW